MEKIHDLSLVQLFHRLDQIEDRGITFIIGKDQEEFIPYASFYKQAQAYRGFLQKHGIGVGDEVIIQTEDNRQCLLAFWACILGGVVPVPLSIGKREVGLKKFFAVWNNLDRPYLITHHQHLQHVLNFAEGLVIHKRQIAERNLLFPTEIPAETSHDPILPDLGDLAFIQYSSGSTGKPKGVMLNHRNLAFNISDLAEVENISASSRALSWVPLTHDLGMIAFHLTCIAAGAQQYIMPTSLFIRRPKLWLEKVSEHRATVLFSPNFGIKYYLNAIEGTDPDELGLDLSSVRNIMNGAEPISARLCDEFVNRMRAQGLSANCIQPAYGLAEASVGVSARATRQPIKEHFLDRASLEIGQKIVYPTRPTIDEGVSFVDLGHPFLHTKIRVCDDQGKILDPEHIGHIQIKGPNVTDGYYNNQSAYQSILSDDGWLKTGDLGFLTKEHSVVITGRLKNMIILQGQNYYAHDLERILYAVPGIDLGKVAVCGLAGDSRHEERLLVFVVYKKPLRTFFPLIDQVNERLVDIIGLAADDIIPVRRLPKTTSGKVQYFQLVQRFRSGHFTDTLRQIEEGINLKRKPQEAVGGASPTIDQLEQWLKTVWAELLDLREIDRESHFFSCGGDSLRLNQLVYRIYQEFKVHIPIPDLLAGPTIASMAGSLAGKLRKPDISSVLIPSLQAWDTFFASDIQRRLWIIDALNDELNAYNLAVCVRISGPLELDKFRASLLDTVDRHEILRTTFNEVGGELVQILHTREALQIDLCEVTNGKSWTREQIDLHSRARITEYMDLQTGPLFKANIYQSRNEEYLLYLIMHHIIADERTIQLIIEDIVAGYIDPAREKQPPTLQYKAYAAWSRSLVRGKDMERHRRYWINQFADGVPVLSIPQDHARPVFQTYNGQSITVNLNREVSKALQVLCQQDDATLFMGLLATVHAVLQRCTGQNDLVIGTPASGRIHPQIAAAIGCFINMIPLRISSLADTSFLDLLRLARQRTEEAISHQALPFDQVVEAVPHQRDLSRHPLFDVMILLRTTDLSAAFNIPGIRAETVALESKSAQLDITFEFKVHADGLQLQLIYNSDIFSSWRMEALADQFCRLLHQAVAHPTRPLIELDLLSEAEKKDIIRGFDTGSVPYSKPYTNILDLFENQVRQNPDKTILLFEETSLKLRELDRLSNQMAHFLKMEFGLQANDLVGVQLPRNHWMCIALLGVLKAGGAFLPIDPDFPKDRVDFMLTDSGCTRLLDEKKMGIFQKNHHQFLSKEVRTGIAPEQLCYVMYTSGSSGRPKGVMVEHRNLLAFTRNFESQFGLHADLVFGAATNFTFDISVLELLGTIVKGITVCLLTGAIEDLRDRLQKKQFDAFQLTPSRLKQILALPDMDLSQLQHLEVLLVGGEAMEPQLFQALKDNLPHTRIINVYGPTETTIWSSFLLLHDTEQLSIGTPLRGEYLYILDKNDQLAPVGVQGEICIGGDGVTRGYINRPALNREKFVKDPFRAGQTIYRTGDFGHWLPDSSISFSGRMDDQVKIRGHRIELDEIKNVLLQLPEITDATVTARFDSEHNGAISAYFVSTTILDIDQLRRKIATHLPTYMLPNYFIALDHIPLNSNGKVDRSALPAVSDKDLRTTYKAPSGELEEAVCHLWENVLQLEKVGVEDNFFRLGGDSLKATKLAVKMNRQWDTQLTVKAIFDHPSVQEQVRLLQSKAAKQRVQWFSNPGSIPITPMQFATFGPDRSASAWQYINIEKRNRFDQELIRAVVFKLIDDHETLRTSFHCDGKTLQQTTQLPNKEGSFAFLDLSKELDQDNKKAQIIDQLVQSRPIEDSVLVRFTLLRMSMHDELLIVVHAAIIDSEGWKILISDLMELYRQMVADRPAHLSVQKNSFYQWAELLQQKMQSENWDRDEAYWHEILEGRFCIPLFQQRQVSSANFQDPKDLATITVELNKRYTQLLREEANASFNTRPEDLLLAALSVAHAPHTDEDRLLILFEGAERIALQSFPQPHRTIGRFTTPFPVLLPVEDELDMALRIKKVKEHLRRVPNRGGTYPQCSSAVVKFPLAFYFLGEWQKTDNDDQFTLHFGESRLFSPLIHDHHQPLYLVAVIIDEKLTFSLHFAAQLYNTSQLTEWAENLKNTLREILDYCINRTTRERTPSDFEYKELSIDDLAKLTAFFE